MAMRGGDEIRGRGRPRGSKKVKPYVYTVYTPGPDVYEQLYRNRHEPPHIAPTLSNECPLPNAKSKILSREPFEDYSWYYYHVKIEHLPKSIADAQQLDQKPPEPREETVQVDLSQILKYVSRAELERFEQQVFRAEAEAEAIMRKVDAKEAARKRLQINAREPGTVHSSKMMMGLPAKDGEVPRRGRGRPRGSRGRGRGAVRHGGLGAADGGVDAHQLRQLLSEQARSESIITDTSESDDDEDTISARPPVSSFVANSALPLSPVAAHRRLSKTKIPLREAPVEEETPKEIFDDLQLVDMGDYMDDDEVEQHRTKRHKAGSTASAAKVPETYSALLWSKYQPVHQYAEFSPEDDNNDEADEEEEEEEEEEYVVEAILAHSYEDGKKFYLVKWEGFEDSSDWLLAEDLAGVQELVSEYHERIRK